MSEFPAVHVGFDQCLCIAAEYLAQASDGSQVSLFRGSTSTTVAQRMGYPMQVPVIDDLRLTRSNLPAQRPLSGIGCYVLLSQMARELEPPSSERWLFDVQSYAAFCVSPVITTSPYGFGGGGHLSPYRLRT